MEKLTFFAVSAPEKLDRIGEYLAERLSRDVVRHRYGCVDTHTHTRKISIYCAVVHCLWSFMTKFVSVYV